MYTDFRSKWLSKIGQRINIPNLAFDEAGLCQLHFDEDLTVNMYRPADTEDLVIFGQLPVENLSAALMRQMLLENRYHRTKNSPVISLTENLAAIEVHFSFTPLEVESVDDVMGMLIGHLEYWRTYVNQAID